MPRRLRQLWNYFVDVPAKPATANKPAGQRRRYGAVGTLDRWLAGSPNKDPLYLSNRTLFQKARVWMVVAIPCAAVLTFVLLSTLGVFDRDRFGQAPPGEASSAEALRKTMPDLDGVRATDVKRIQIIEMQVIRGADAELKGKVRNTTGRIIRSLEIVVNLTDGSGSQLGAVSVHLVNLPADAAVDFQQPLQQKTAYNALVREVHVR
jgi:hypothetical protein